MTTDAFREGRDAAVRGRRQDVTLAGMAKAPA
jgi:hypothetical protein